MQITERESLQKHSWWKIGGKADYFCQPENGDELKEALLWAKNHQLKITALGSGTNVLISDFGVKGLVVSTQKLSRLDFKTEEGILKIQAETGVLKSHLMAVFRKYNLAPAVFLAGLPGCVGGGVIMNAGIDYPQQPTEFAQITRECDIMTAKGLKLLKQEDIVWQYRHTKGWPESSFIYRARFHWPLEPRDRNVNQKIKSLLKKRRSSQPLSEASCGSVFKNPYPHYAGQLIEKAGLKGLNKGAAVVSEKHGNFIINKGGARAVDVDDLIKVIQKTIQEKFGIRLEKEVHYLGRWNQ